MERLSSELGPEHPPGSPQGSLHPQAEAGSQCPYLAHRGAAPGCCWGSRPGSPPQSLMARSYPGEGKDRMSLLPCQSPAEVPGRSQGATATAQPGLLTIHMPSKGTWSWKSFTMSCHHS